MTTTRVSLTAVLAVMVAALGVWLYAGIDLLFVEDPRSIVGDGWLKTVAMALATCMFMLLFLAPGRGLAGIYLRRGVGRFTLLAIMFLGGAAFIATAAAPAGFFWAASSGPLLIGLALLRPDRALRSEVRSRLFIPPERVMALLLLATAWIAALAPEVESDGLRYHLVTLQEWVRHHKLVSIPFSAHSNLPAMQSFLAAMIPGRPGMLPSAYQLLHVAHGAALVMVAGGLTRSLFRSLGALRRDAVKTRSFQHHAAAAGALLVVGIPVVLIVMAWPFSDVAAASYFVAAIYIAAGGIMPNALGRQALASLLLGATLATKLSMLPLVGIAGLWLLAREVPGARNRFKTIAALLLPGAIILAPWLFKSWLYTGNPVYPVAWSIFGGPEWSLENELIYKGRLASKGMVHDLISFVRSPLDVTIYWQRFESQNPGPGPLALLIPALIGVVVLGVRRKLRAIWTLPGLCGILIVGGWCAWFATYQSVRMAIPMLVLVVCLGGATVLWLAMRAGLFAVGRVGLAILALAGGGYVVTYHLVSDGAYAGALGGISEGSYIRHRFSAYDAVQWLNNNTKENEPVIYIGEHRMAYAQNFTPVASDWFDTPRILTEIRATKDNAQLLARWKGMKARYVLMNLGELRQYSDAFFKPRFTAAEWQRFEGLVDLLSKHIVQGDMDGSCVCETP